MMRALHAASCELTGKLLLLVAFFHCIVEVLPHRPSFEPVSHLVLAVYLTHCVQ